MTTDKTPATLAVDVLAVIEAAARSLWVEGEPVNPHAAGLISARAAVAELIEADEELIAAEMGVACYEAMTRYSSRNYRTACYVREREATARRRAALARVKGESA